MDDLMSKIQNVLNDKESMKQIQELAGMLSGETVQEENSNEKASGDSSQDSQVRSNNGKAHLDNGLADLISRLSGLSDEEKSSSAKTNDFDLEKLLKLQGIMSQAGKSDKNTDLLLALKPLLKEENQAKVDRLVKIFKLMAIYPALKESGLLGGDLFGIL